MIRAALLCLALSLIACRRVAPEPELEVYGTVPPFQLIAQTGQPFNSSELAGKIWVADFIFTNCPGVCPRMTAQMHQVQEAAHHMPNVHLVSFTVDPARDTAPVLAAYAKAHHAAHEQWTFLTGPQATLNDLCRNTFKLGDVDGSLTHSTRFILIDGQSRIRGYYDTSDRDSIPKLVSDIHALLRQSS